MKKIDWEIIISAFFALLISSIFTIGIGYFIYKVFSGIYHLLDKLIDKI